MALNDPLANVLSRIHNAESSGKQHCVVKPSSRTIRRVLEILQEHSRISNFDLVQDGQGGRIVITLSGNLNMLKVIKPRLSVKWHDLDNYVQRFLPGKNIGFLILTTSQGILTHSEVRELGIGGRLLAFVY